MTILKEDLIVWKKAKLPMGREGGPRTTVLVKLLLPAGTLCNLNEIDAAEDRARWKSYGPLKYRAERAKVLQICDVLGKPIRAQVAESGFCELYSTPVKYRVGRFVRSLGRHGKPRFARPYKEVCAAGIHFYLSVAAAAMH